MLLRLNRPCPSEGSRARRQALDLPLGSGGNGRQRLPRSCLALFFTLTSFAGRRRRGYVVNGGRRGECSPTGSADASPASAVGRDWPVPALGGCVGALLSVAVTGGVQSGCSFSMPRLPAAPRPAFGRVAGSPDGCAGGCRSLTIYSRSIRCTRPGLDDALRPDRRI